MSRVIPAACGLYFDLSDIMSELNQRYFKQKVKASIKWGQRRAPLGAKKRSIRLGSYHPHKKVILINPCLDQAMVPKICVERIVFHEMSHQIFPAKKDSRGRILVHYPEFKAFEKGYPYLKEADLWIDANLNRLLSF